MEYEITTDTFTTGLIAGLAAEGVTKVSMNEIDHKISSAFDWLCLEAKRRKFELMFHITENPMHEFSPGVQMVLNDAVQSDLIYFQGNTLIIKIRPSFAHRYLEDLPGGEDMWRTVAKHLLVAS